MAEVSLMAGAVGSFRGKSRRVGAPLAAIALSAAVVFMPAAAAGAVPEVVGDGAPMVDSEFPICPDCWAPRLVRLFSPLSTTKTLAPPIPVCPDCWAPRLLRGIPLLRN